MATFPKQRQTNLKSSEVLCQKITYNPYATTNTVTQGTNRTTAVELNTTSGAITTHNASLAAEASANFTVTNDKVKIGDVPVLAIRSGSNGGNTAVSVVTVADGSFVIKVSNNNAAAGTAETGAIVINFVILGAE